MLLRTHGTRPLSTTTRIKTGRHCWMVHLTIRTRPLSTTTRIKTCLNSVNYSWNLKVRDHCPLQQGLRLLLQCLESSSKGTRPLSTTTRIKTNWLIVKRTLLTSTRPLSTTTRIKTCLPTCNQPKTAVRDHCPLQQGLRLLSPNLLAHYSISTRPLSTTTRIKTFPPRL